MTEVRVGVEVITGIPIFGCLVERLTKFVLLFEAANEVIDDGPPALDRE